MNLETVLNLEKRNKNLIFQQNNLSNFSQLTQVVLLELRHLRSFKTASFVFTVSQLSPPDFQFVKCNCPNCTATYQSQTHRYVN